MKPKTIKKIEEPEVISETAIVPVETSLLDKPVTDTKFAHASAVQLMAIVEKNNWAKKLGGDKPHLVYEAWQTVGKYYGYTVKTHDADYVELGGTWGFKAKATVVNEITGIEVGSAEALCMSDEGNWKSKPKFQLASMAQTRAGSKALRQILGFVVALAGYNTTPSEEMDGVRIANATPQQQQVRNEIIPITVEQKGDIIQLLGKLGKTQLDLNNLVKAAFKLDSYQLMNKSQATGIIERLQRDIDHLKKAPVGNFESADIDVDEIDKGIKEQRMGK